jgi:hypothetical protein
MKPVNAIKVCLLVLMIVFCLLLNDQTAAIEAGYCPVSTILETVSYPENWNLAWDPDNPDEIISNSSVVVNVIGRCPPYYWAASGSGFSLAESQTQGESNMLTAASGACGSVTVNVSDSCNNTTAGALRNPAQGQWVLISQTCEMPGAPTTSWVNIGIGLWRAQKIAGGKKQETTILHYSYFGNSAFEIEDCDDGGQSVCALSCTAHSLCWDPEGCDECLTPPDPFPITADPCGIGLTQTLHRTGPQAWKTDCVYCGPTYPAYNRWAYSGICTCINSMNYYEWQCN